VRSAALARGIARVSALLPIPLDIVQRAGTRLEATGDLALARNCFRRAFKRAPQRELSRWGLASTLSTIALRDNDLDAFLEALPHLGALGDSNIWGMRATARLATLLAHTGYYTDALPHYERLLRGHAETPALSVEYAEALAKLGRRTEALEQIPYSATVSTDAALRAVRLEVLAGRFDSAAERLNRLERQTPADAIRIDEERVLLLARAGRLADALALRARVSGFRRIFTSDAGRSAEGGVMITVVCWGVRACDSLLDMCLPSQLVESQIPAVGTEPDLVYRLYTSDADADRLLSHPSLHALAALVRTEVIAFPSRVLQAARSKYEAANWCHQHAVLDANLKGRSLVFISPDSVIAAGGLVWLLSERKRGTRTILISGPRVTKETALPAIAKMADKGTLHGARTLRISPRSLVNVVLDHPHHSMMGGFVDAGYVNDFWSCLFSRVGSSGLLARQMHLHPLMVTPDVLTAIPEQTVDSLFVGEACTEVDGVRVVEDSDEFCAISWSARGENTAMRKYPERSRRKAALIAHLARRHVAPFNLGLLRHRIRFHTEDLGPEWMQAERTSDTIVAEVIELLSEPSLAVRASDGVVMK